MRKYLVLSLLALLLAGCPRPVDPANPTDPYATARTIILSSQFALGIADGVFETWALGQDDTAKVSAARIKFGLARAAVSDGLQLALAGLAIAEQAKKDPDVPKLMAQAEAAWQVLRKLLADLWALTRATSSTSQPSKAFTMADLPPTLLAR